MSATYDEITTFAKIAKKTAYADSQEITNVLCNLMQEFCEN